MKVLIVDDEPDIVETTAMLLRNRGHVTVPMYDWRGVVEALSEGDFDVVLHDMRMPGLDLRAHVADMRAAADVHVILFTANRIVDAEAAAMDVDAFLPKPFDPESLYLAIEERSAAARSPASRR